MTIIQVPIIFFADLIEESLNLVSFCMIAYDGSAVFTKFGCSSFQSFFLTASYVNSCTVISQGPGTPWSGFILKILQFRASFWAPLQPFPIPLEAPVTKHTRPARDILISQLNSQEYKSLGKMKINYYPDCSIISKFTRTVCLIFLLDGKRKRENGWAFGVNSKGLWYGQFLRLEFCAKSRTNQANWFTTGLS